MSFVSLEDDSSVDSESEFFLDTLKHPPPTHHHPIVEKHGKYSDIPSIEDVREDSPTWKASHFERSEPATAARSAVGDGEAERI